MWKGCTPATASAIGASYLFLFGVALFASPDFFLGGGGSLLEFFSLSSEGRDNDGGDPNGGNAGEHPPFDPMTSYHFRLASASLLAMGASRFLFVLGDEEDDSISRERAWLKITPLPAVLSLTLFCQTTMASDDSFDNAAFAVLSGAHLLLVMMVALATNTAADNRPASETDHRRKHRQRHPSGIDRVSAAISAVSGTAGMFLCASPSFFFGAEGGLIPFFGNAAEPDPVRLFSSRLLGACLSWNASPSTWNALAGRQQLTDERELVLRAECLGGILNGLMFLGNVLDGAGYFKRRVYGAVLLVQVLHVLLMVAALVELPSGRSSKKAE
mmetsp:Transcript_13478/g.39361  ORF Transcript_13478/g.39361 Transcript_13478/m.39361 type:complete len:329 (-) Transcript_13478:832-1818(-)